MALSKNDDDESSVQWPSVDETRHSCDDDDDDVRILDDSFLHRPHKPLQFRLGQGEVISGVELCVKSMTYVGQRSRFAVRPCKKYAYFDVSTKSRERNVHRCGSGNTVDGMELLANNVQCMTRESTGALGDYRLFYEIELVNVREGDQTYVCVCA